MHSPEPVLRQPDPHVDLYSMYIISNGPKISHRRKRRGLLQGGCPRQNAECAGIHDGFADQLVLGLAAAAYGSAINYSLPPRNARE